MGKGKAWPEIPEGMAVYCQGLRLVAIEPLTREERNRINGLFVRRLVWVLLPGFAFVFLGLPIATGFGFKDFTFEAFATVGTVAFFLAMVLLAKADYRNKAVFQGCVIQVPNGSWLAGRLRKIGLQGEVTAEVLPDGLLWMLNGEAVLKWDLRAGLSYVAEVEPDDDRSFLTDQEKFELKSISPGVGAVWLLVAVAGSVIHALALLSRGLFSVPVGRGLELVVAGVSTLLVLVGLLGYLRPQARLKRDAAQGILVRVGNADVLKHSRMAWTVAGAPAPWRRHPSAEPNTRRRVN